VGLMWASTEESEEIGSLTDSADDFRYSANEIRKRKISLHASVGWSSSGMGLRYLGMIARRCPSHCQSCE